MDTWWDWAIINESSIRLPIPLPSINAGAGAEQIAHGWEQWIYLIRKQRAASLIFCRPSKYYRYTLFESPGKTWYSVNISPIVIPWWKIISKEQTVFFSDRRSDRRSHRWQRSACYRHVHAMVTREGPLFTFFAAVQGFFISLTGQSLDKNRASFRLVTFNLKLVTK